ncbi:MAG TPA: hypothetical protein VMW09_09775 [Desulfatiglandales bacterium]|nr:hypothetical protein [Desulfatiglandales bacterium]
MSNGKSDIITRWNDPEKDHDAIILEPHNKTNDLVLTSRVFVQSFLTLQRHEYHYIALNGSAANGVYCDMIVEWNGVGKRLRVPPTSPMDHRVDSWFSPQKIKASANVDPIAGNIPFRARHVVAEYADAYVPWNHFIWKPLKRLPKEGIKYLIGKRLGLSSVFLIGTYRSSFNDRSSFNEILKVESLVGFDLEQYSYELNITGGKEYRIVGEIAEMTYNGEPVRFSAEPGRLLKGSFKSSKEPGEIWKSLKLDVFSSILPVALLIPREDSK